MTAVHVNNPAVEEAAVRAARRAGALALWYAAADADARDAAAARLDADADAGRFLAARESAELDDLRLGPALSEFLTAVLPDRVGRRARAAAVLGAWRAAGYALFVRHAALRILPELPRELRPLFHDLTPELTDILDDERRSDPAPEDVP
jgi:hypothetical protein